MGQGEYDPDNRASKGFASFAISSGTHVISGERTEQWVDTRSWVAVKLGRASEWIAGQDRPALYGHSYIGSVYQIGYMGWRRYVGSTPIASEGFQRINTCV